MVLTALVRRKALRKHLMHVIAEGTVLSSVTLVLVDGLARKHGDDVKPFWVERLEGDSL